MGETCRALIVDDHDIVLEGLRRALEREGISVVGATGDVDEAVQVARREQPDLCLVDLRLGPDSGLEAIPRLLDAAPGARVAMLTSFPEGRSARAAIEAGATGFIVKDTPVPELCRQLRAVVGGSLVLDQRVAAAVVRGGGVTLTAQERSVLILVAEGLTNREIGSRLYLSAHTVKEYLANVMRRLGTHTRAQTVAKAIQAGLIDVPES